MDSNVLPPVTSDAKLRLRLKQDVTRYCPHWMADSVDDIVQVAWLRLTAARKKSERNRNPGPTLISRVAYCATVDEMRRHKRRKEVPMDPVTEQVQGEVGDPARRVRSREIGSGIRDCLTGLAPNRCLAVALYLQGHTAPETGVILGWSLRKTENLIFRGMADLRRCLAAKGLTP
jgi:RNA polymerase sigma-70 factor (ECF subfamily)